MPIPNADSAFVSPEKLSSYLLNLAHPVGGPKARWFISVGYDPDDPDQLEADLLGIVRGGSDFVVEDTRFGVTYAVMGPVTCPNGQRITLRTVWIAESRERAPRLVTAYPDQATEDERTR